MKKLKSISIFFLILSLFSCKENEKEKEFDSIFDKVIVYDYGRSIIGITYDIPLKFFFGGNEIASFRLYSMDKNLANGVYKYSDVKVIDYIPFNNYGSCSDKTFFKDKCKWGNNIITGGSVTVDKQEDKYTFIIDVTDNKGEQHYGKFSGKIKKEDWYEKSKTGGLFDIGLIWDSALQPNDGTYAFALQYNSGDANNEIQINARLITNNPTDATGIYQFENDGHCIYTNYPYEGSTAKMSQFIKFTGTIIVTRVNEPWKYKVDIDVVSEKGVAIKGSFDGCDMSLYGNWFE